MFVALRLMILIKINSFLQVSCDKTQCLGLEILVLLARRDGARVYESESLQLA